MNSLIKQQLTKVKNVSLPQFNDSTTKLFVSKLSANHLTKVNYDNEVTLHIAREYIIKVASYIVNPPAGFNLHENWNKGIKPDFDTMKCLVIQQAGKMVKIKGNQYNLDLKQEFTTKWEGWLPLKSITIIEEL